MEHWIYFSFTARLTVDSWTPMRSATSARDRGTRWPGPLRKKDSWNSRIHSAHAMRVERRCSMALTIHLAWRTLPVR